MDRFAGSEHIAPSLTERVHGDLYYGSIPPIKQLITNYQDIKIDYYGLQVVPTGLPKESYRCQELIYGLVGVFDKGNHIIGLMDVSDSLSDAKRHGKAQIPTPMIDLRNINDSFIRKSQLQGVFMRREIQLPEDEIPTAVAFLNDFIDAGTQYSSEIFKLPSYKVLEFKPTYSTWKYCRYLFQTGQIKLSRKYFQLLQKQHSIGSILFPTITGDINYKEMDELVQTSYDIFFNHFGSKESAQASLLANKFGQLYFQLTENKWEALSYGGKRSNDLLNKFALLNNEELNVLFRSFQFMIHELQATINQPDIFMKRVEFFQIIVENIAQAFDIQAMQSVLKIPPDAFDELVGIATTQGKSEVQRLIHFFLNVSTSSTSKSKEHGEERSHFYKRFLRALAEGTVKPETTTGDTPIERTRFKEAIDHIIRTKNIDPEQFSVLEIGVGNGRILNWLTEQYPKMKAFGIDIETEKELRQNGLSSSIAFKETSVTDLTQQLLKQSFGTEKIDIIIAPWSVFGDLTDEELEKTFNNLKQIARTVVFDVPLVVLNQGGYLQQMSEGSQPHTLRVAFDIGNEKLVKNFELRPPERYIQLCDDKKIKLNFIPPTNHEREAFLKKIRSEKLERTSDIKIPQWITQNNKPRITFVGDCEEVHEDT